jgi:hypothetical protein
MAQDPDIALPPELAVHVMSGSSVSSELTASPQEGSPSVAPLDATIVAEVVQLEGGNGV